MDKIELLIRFIKKISENGFTGQLRLNFHEGNLSEKVEKKESVKIGNDPLIPINWGKAIDADIESGKFSRSLKEVLDEKSI